MTPRIVPTTTARTVNSRIAVSGRMKGSSLGAGPFEEAMVKRLLRPNLPSPLALATQFEPFPELPSPPWRQLPFRLPGPEGGDGDEPRREVVEDVPPGKRGLPCGGLRRHERPGAHRRRARRRHPLPVRPVAQPQQEIGDRDVDGADLVARPAQARGLGKVGQLGESLAKEEGRQDRAHRPGIDAPVGVAPRLAVYGADIEARAAADAAQDIPALARKDPRPAVVHEDHVHLVGPVRLARRPRPRDELVVHRDLLGGAGARDQVEKEREVPVAREDLLYADKDDMAPRGRQAEPRVALVRHDHDPAALGHDEVRAGQAGVRLEVLVAHELAGPLRDHAGVLVVGAEPAPLEELRDLPAVLVDDRLDDVRRAVVVQLDYELAEVRLQGLDAVLLQVVAEADLLADHRLRLDEPLRPPRLEYGVDGLARRIGRRRPVDLGAVRGEPRLERRQVSVEILDHVLLDLAGKRPQAVGDRVVSEEDLRALLVPDLRALVDRGLRLGTERRRGIVDRLRPHARLANASRSTCAKCIVITRMPSLAASPERCMRQLMSPETSTSGFAARTWSSFRSPMAAEMCGNATENVPPKPQHCSASPNSTSRTPAIEDSSRATASLLAVPRVWHDRWSATAELNLPGQDVTPRPFTMKSPSSHVRRPRLSISARSGSRSNSSAAPWKSIAAHDPEGTTIGYSPAKVRTAWRTTLRDADQSPPLNAGWPQHVWPSGKRTSQPRCSSTSTVAAATSSWNASHRHVAMSCTRLPTTGVRPELSFICKRHGLRRTRGSAWLEMIAEAAPTQAR